MLWNESNYRIIDCKVESKKVRKRFKLKKLTLVNHLSDQIPTFCLARTNGLRVDGNFSQMFEIIQLQNEFQMSERLNERNHGEVVLCGPHLDGLDVVSRQSVSGAHIPERTPEWKHILVLNEKSRRSCIFKERKYAL